MKTALGLAALLCFSCSSAKIAGGAPVAPGSEPEGMAVAYFNVTRCEDANGARVPEQEGHVSLVRMPDARIVLVERRPGYDSLVVENGWDEGDARVFQLAMKRTGGGPFLREYRVPVAGAVTGRVVVVDRVASWRDSSRGFHARYEGEKPALSCDLAPT
ncbi:MAG TPA: hypothetical protein VH062_18780 [Polyangiaceae bacterium]|jgi:hypothetical protein|nr:hypothetical protein [Polyangiaceae bacterium]